MIRQETPWAPKNQAEQVHPDAASVTQLLQPQQGFSIATSSQTTDAKIACVFKLEQEEEEKGAFTKGATPCPEADSFLRLKQPHGLFAHQAEVIRWVQARERSPDVLFRGTIVALEMGLGKTLVALGLIVLDWGVEQLDKPALVVCNKSLVTTFAEDARKFFGTDLEVLILHKEFMPKGTSMKSLDASNFTGRKIILTTYDQLPVLKKLGSGADFFGSEFSRVVCDESHQLTPTTQNFKCLQEIRSKYRTCLTGTPANRFSKELHAQFLFCGLPENIKFTQEMFEHHALASAVAALSVEDANVNLPPMRVVDLVLDLSPTERAQYDAAHRTCKATLDQFKAKSTTFAGVLSQFNLLRRVCTAPQLASGLLASGAGFVPTQASTKITRCLQIVSSMRSTDKCIIFSEFIPIIEMLAVALGNRGAVRVVTGNLKCDKRDASIHDFQNDPQVRVLVITTKIGCMGLNLTCANHVILMEPSWNEATMRQATARAWRIGQTRTVTLWRMTVRGTIEETMTQLRERRKTDIVWNLSLKQASKDVISDVMTDV